MLTREARRRAAPLVLVAAALGAYVMIERNLPEERDVVLDFGDAAHDVAAVEIEWTRARSGSSEADLTTRWHFEKGTAPARLHARVRLPAGEWNAEVAVERHERPGAARWSGAVNLERTPWWKRDNLRKSSVVLPVREALR